MHSSGLEFCIDKFKSSNLNNELFRTSNNQIDTLALINFFEEETRNYLANNRCCLQLRQSHLGYPDDVGRAPPVATW